MNVFIACFNKVLCVKPTHICNEPQHCLYSSC